MLRPLRRTNIRPRTRRDLKLARIWDQNFQSIVWIFEHLVFRIFSMRRRFLRSMQRLLSSTVPSTRSVRFPSPEEPRLFQISERPTFSGFYTIFYPFSFFSYQLRRSTLLLFCLSLLTHIYIHTHVRAGTHTYSTPVRGSMDAGQPDPDGLNPLLTLLVGRSRGEDGNRENRIVNNIGEKKYGEGKPNVNVTTNPLDISLIGTRTDQSNNDQSSDGPGRTTSATSKPRGKPAGKSKRSIRR